MFATEQCLLVLSHHPDVWIMAAQYLDQTAKHLTEKAVRIPSLPFRVVTSVSALTAEVSFQPSPFSLTSVVIEGLTRQNLFCDNERLKICAINSSPFDDDCVWNQSCCVVFSYMKGNGEMFHVLGIAHQALPKAFDKMRFTPESKLSYNRTNLEHFSLRTRTLRKSSTTKSPTSSSARSAAF